MESGRLLGVLERVLDSSPAAVLTTIDSEGAPRSRWMVAGVLRGAPGYLYAVTMRDNRKAEQVMRNSTVSWLVQNSGVDEILHVSGHAVVVDNPSLKSTVMEAIGRHLTTFWNVNTGTGELVVIETVISSIEYVRPATGDVVHESAR